MRILSWSAWFRCFDALEYAFIFREWYYSKIAENCGCIHHNHPGWSNAPINCVCICGRDEKAESVFKSSFAPEYSSVASALKGVVHGIVDFGIRSLHELQSSALYIGWSELEAPLHEKVEMITAIEESQNLRSKATAEVIMNLLSIDPSDTTYQSFRSGTTRGLEIGSLIAGGYGAAKGVIGFSKLARMPAKMTKIGAKGMHNMETALRVGNFKYTNTAGSHITDLVKRGRFKGELSRPYMKSPHTINEIMAARKPISDPVGTPGGLRWDVPGTFRGNEGTWELVLHPESEIIYHFNFK